MSTAIDQGARNPFVLRDLIDSTLDSVTVDQQLTPQLLVDLGRRYSAFEPEDLKTYSYPGFISSEGTVSIVRGMDTDAEPILALFAGAASDDPATVLVRIKADAERRDLALDVADYLAAEGFEPDQVQTIDAPVRESNAPWPRRCRLPRDIVLDTLQANSVALPVSASNSIR